MRTASRLHPCGYVDVLSVKRKRTKAQRDAMERGNLFHKCIEMKTGSEDREVQAWVDLAMTALQLPPQAVHEVALGLSPGGRYVAVDETEPHVYVARDSTPLLTAGRADVAWSKRPIAVVGDFKTGKTHLGPPAQIPQLLALGFANADLLGCDSMQCGVYYARDGQWDWSPVIALDSSAAADAWDLVVKCATATEKPNPGDWCYPCWERKACPHAI